MSQITTHILDTTRGKPAQGVTIILSQQKGEDWNEMARGQTNADGRIADLLPKETLVEKGIYKMTFLTKPYFEAFQVNSFYPFVEICFDIQTSEHYHVPLLLNPFGYATYRGS